MKFKKYEEYLNEKEFKGKEGYTLDSFIDEEIEIKMSEFEYLDEGFLYNLKKMGFWKGLKRMGTKIASKVSNYIKDNKELQQSIRSAITKGGEEVADDLGKIMGEFSEKIEAAERRAKEAEDELYKERKNN